MHLGWQCCDCAIRQVRNTLSKHVEHWKTTEHFFSDSQQNLSHSWIEPIIICLQCLLCLRLKNMIQQHFVRSPSLREKLSDQYAGIELATGKKPFFLIVFKKCFCLFRHGDNNHCCSCYILYLYNIWQIIVLPASMWFCSSPLMPCIHLLCGTSKTSAC